MLNIAKALLFQTGYHLKFWFECALIVVFLIITTQSSTLTGKTLFEFITRKQPNYSVLRSFDYLEYVFLVKEINKFMFRAMECVLFGYAESEKAYKVLNLRTNKLCY